MRFPPTGLQLLQRFGVIVGLGVSSVIAVAVPASAAPEPSASIEATATPDEFVDGVIGLDEALVGFANIPAPDVTANCGTLYLPFASPQSCTVINGGFVGPPGDSVLREASVRVGPNTGRMQFVIVRFLRSRANGGGPIICCFTRAASQSFIPAPNIVTTIPVNLPMANRTDNVGGEQIEVLDRLAISVLSPTTPLPAIGAPAPNLSWVFGPHLRSGEERLLAQTPTGPAIPTISGLACSSDGTSGEEVCQTVGLPGTTFTGVIPSRRLDTRSSRRVAAGSTTRVQIGGVGGVDDDAAGAVLNVTAVNPAQDGFLTVFPCGENLPDVSNVNFRARQTVANAAFATLGSDGGVCVFSSAETDLLVDVAGALFGGFADLSPRRLLDTRAAGPVAAGSITRVQIAGAAGVPDDAVAAVLNVTAVGPAGGGFLTVFPCDESPPDSSNVNFRARQTVPNAVVATLGPRGDICVLSSVATNLLVDLNGALAVGYAGQRPDRLLDTRPATRVGAGAVVRVPIAGAPSVPPGAVAAVLNLTAVGPSDGGFLTAFPCNESPPESSNVNFRARQTVANAAVVTLGSGGGVCVFSSAETDLIVDLNGVFT